LASFVPVRFSRPWGPYNSGEVAGFEEDLANSLVEAGIAERVVSETALKPETKSEVPNRAVTRSKNRGTLVFEEKIGSE